MGLYNSKLYQEDIRYVAGLDLPWSKLKNKKLMISGATGLIGSFLVDVLLEKNKTDDLNCTIYALGRSYERALNRFENNCESKQLVFVQYDVKEELNVGAINNVDYILHLASNTHPLQYSTDPIGTIITNIFGLKNLLDFASSHHVSRFVFASSNEIYGENRGDVELFDESYCGYIDSNTMRAGYPESKRCGEALCQAYRKQIGIEIVIPRVTRSYGPTMLMSDSKAISQFIKKGVAGEDIVLKSEGTQYYSFQYMADTVSGIFYVLLCGQDGEAYNIADESGDITLRDLAALIAGIKGKKVVFEIPEAVEMAGYSKATKARLDGSKLKKMGWKPHYDIKQGIEQTIRVLDELGAVK